MTDEDDDRAVGFLNSDRMTLAIIVGNARRHDFVSMRASAQHDCKTDKRSRDAVGAIAADGYSGCHRFRPRPASVGIKPKGPRKFRTRPDPPRTPDKGMMGP